MPRDTNRVTSSLHHTNSTETLNASCGQDTVAGKLHNALSELTSVSPRVGTEAMIVHIAKSQNPAYITNNDLSIHSIAFSAMTDQHKMQIVLIIESMVDR